MPRGILTEIQKGTAMSHLLELTELFILLQEKTVGKLGRKHRKADRSTASLLLHGQRTTFEK